MIKVIYWDLGGVWVQNNIAPALEQCGIKYGPQQKEAWHKHRICRINQQQFLEEALRGTGLEHKLEEVRKRSYDLLELQPNGALPVIKAINKLKKYKQGVISNHSIEWGNHIREKFRINDYVAPELVIISAECGLDKPNAGIYNLACRLAQVESDEILFLDNNWENVHAARNARLNAEFFINTTSAVNAVNYYGVFGVKKHLEAQ